MSRRQRRYEKKSLGWKAQSGLRVVEWQRATCKNRSFLSRDTCRGCERDERHDEYINERAESVAWSHQGGSSTGAPACPTSKPKGAAEAPAQARQQLAEAKAAALPDECIRILENKVQQEETAMKQAQPLGQNMDQARARFRRAANKPKGAAQALALAQQQLAQAKTSAMPEVCLRILENEVQKEEAAISVGQISSCCRMERRRWQHCRRPRRISSKRSRR